MLRAASRRRVPGAAWTATLATMSALSVIALSVIALTVTAGAVPARADSVRNAEMWVLDAINAPAAWPVSRGAGVTVAVIDSGVAPEVPDLANSVRTGPDLTGVHTSSSDPNWGMHGTWMASLVAGHGHGGSDGIIGVASQSAILSIRVITDKLDPGFAQYQRQPLSTGQQELADAIRYAVRHHVGVISMSLGYGAPSRPVRAALQDAYAHNIVVVASSGNSGDAAEAAGKGSAPYSFPADYPGVLGVAAVGADSKPAAFSSDNLSVQVAAPGVSVPAEGRDGQYWLVSGTSPACALTAGVAALIKSKYPALPAAKVINAITSSTWHRPRGGYDRQVGFGTVNAAAALTAASQFARGGQASHALTAASHFGGGPQAVTSAPVRPRGPLAILLYCLLGGACLILVGVAAIRLFALRQPPTRRAARSRPPAPGWGRLTPDDHRHGFGEPDLDEPGLDESGLGGPGCGEPGLGEPGFGEPGFGEPGFGEPGFGEQSLGEPGHGGAGIDDRFGHANGSGDDVPGRGLPSGFTRFPWQSPPAGRHAAPYDRGSGIGGPE
jgi:Subtilase family